jgi:hypothetical protein
MRVAVASQISQTSAAGQPETHAIARQGPGHAVRGNGGLSTAFAASSSARPGERVVCDLKFLVPLAVCEFKSSSPAVGELRLTAVTAAS